MKLQDTFKSAYENALNETDRIGGIKFPFPRYLKDLYEKANPRKEFRLLKKRSSRHNNELMRAFFGETEIETAAAVKPMLEALGIETDGENPNAKYFYGDCSGESSSLYMSVKITAKEEKNISSENFGGFALPAGKSMYIVNVGEVVPKAGAKTRAKIQKVSQLFENVLSKNEKGNYVLEKGKLDADMIAAVMEKVKKAVGKQDDPEYEIYEELFSAEKGPDGSFAFSPDCASFLAESNVGNAISEIVVPVLLTKGIEKFSGTDVLETVTEGKNGKYVKTEWPASATNEIYDYILSFETGEFEISAKFNEGHKISLVSQIFRKNRGEKIFEGAEGKLAVLKKAVEAEDNSRFVANGNLPFGAWILGYSLTKLSKTDEIPDSDFAELKNLWTALDKTDETVSVDETFYKNLIDRFEYEYGTSFSNSAFPFSLTYFFEKYFADNCERILPGFLEKIKNAVIDDSRKQIKLRSSKNGLEIEVLRFDKNMKVFLKPFGNSGAKKFSSKWQFPKTPAELKQKLTDEKELVKNVRNNILRGGGGQTIGMTFSRSSGGKSVPTDYTGDLFV